MSDSPKNPNFLLDKISYSTSKNNRINIPNNTSISNFTATTDNEINHVSTSIQFSDNTSNPTGMTINNETKYNRINYNKINENIQSVPNSNLFLNQNIHINTPEKKSFAETILNETFPKKE